MEWTRSETLVLALHNCTQCRGAGLRLVAKGPLAPCNCVLRSIFRMCYDRFTRCVQQERYVSRVTLEAHRGRSRPSTWGRKDEEYIADFCLVAKRVLTEAEHQLFRFHFILGADWKLCTRKSGMDRGMFFHAIYRIEQKLGRKFRELEPYALFPLDEYFHGPSRLGPVSVSLPREPRVPERSPHLQFPVLAQSTL